MNILDITVIIIDTSRFIFFALVLVGIDSFTQTKRSVSVGIGERVVGTWQQRGLDSEKWSGAGDILHCISIIIFL